jgi:hypothetical protein
MIVYIDESRGCRIRDRQQDEWVQILAIFTTVDVDTSKWSDNPSPYSATLGKFGNESEIIGSQAASICNSIFAQLESQGQWNLFWAQIEKSFAVATWFVDVIFGFNEEDFEIYRWYRDDVGQHTLCMTIDRALSKNLRDRIAKAEQTNDYAEVVKCTRPILDIILNSIDDVNILKIIERGFNWAVQNSDQVQRAMSTLNDGFAGDAATRIACVSLLREVSLFLARNRSKVVTFNVLERAPVSSVIKNLLSLIDDIGEDNLSISDNINIFKELRGIEASVENNVHGNEVAAVLGNALRILPSDSPLLKYRSRYPGRMTEYIVSNRASEMLLRKKGGIIRH